MSDVSRRKGEGGGVQTVELGRMTLSSKEVRGRESKKETRVRQQEEPSEMKAVIKRLQISRKGFPGCCLQLADHTLRG